MKKVEKVMGEFKRGNLRSGSGDKVTDRDQAVAIAMSEAEDMKDKKDYAGGGKTKKYMRGGKTRMDGCAVRGKTKGKKV